MVRRYSKETRGTSDAESFQPIRTMSDDSMDGKHIVPSWKKLSWAERGGEGRKEGCEGEGEGSFIHILFFLLLLHSITTLTSEG